MMAPGIALITEFEGFRPEAYPDPIKGWTVPTIGYGTTRYADGAPVRRGDKITRAEAERVLSAWVGQEVVPVLSKIPAWARMNTNQRGALISFAYNLGAHFYGQDGFRSISQVCDSPARWMDAAWVTSKFELYRNPGSAAEKGLLRRRRAEAALFLRPVNDG